MKPCKVGVVGTGTMATGTAVLLICNCYPTVIHGRTEESCEKGLRLIHESLDDLIAAGVLSQSQKEKALGYLVTTTAYEDLAACAFVIESTAETIETKRDVMGHLEAVCPPETILSSTTSAISANEIAATMLHKERFMVAHSWNPPHLVPLVEIVKSEFTSQEAVDREVELLEDLGRVPVVLKKDAPGFIGNRLHHALFREAEHIIEEGIADADAVDKTILYSIGQRYSSIGLMEYWDHIPVSLQTNIQTYLFPHLCNADKPGKLLTDKTATGEDLYDWTAEKSADYELRKRKPFYRFATVKLKDETK
ncbi:3-hydroxyacyl-CoA dehydrogenase family protein [Oscillibacter sp.]|uniref:3-hydroxyacyl-CoA dehydrogenase n=1 Tax=Oscillibacter sp. TaxID=1945593 RepID=UPI00260DE805|nr:3-hydroxyacyl-CoA dehydrogenase family protein [Oscillibacter sp.]MDD3346338.1 3-hydroxyacyl-CoA dehydrogenase family protein [Oscillibacter sp.]